MSDDILSIILHVDLVIYRIYRIYGRMGIVERMTFITVIFILKNLLDRHFGRHFRLIDQVK